MTSYAYIDSPLGRLLLTSREDKLTGLYFADQSHARTVSDWMEQDDAPIFAETAQQLEDYASGNRQEFDLPVHLVGGPFQVSVWQAIAKIPFGSTVTYGELAQRMGRPVTDARAIGTATGQNPICWIIPCHRVVGKGGALTGYAGGLPRKSALLDFEAARSEGREAVLGSNETDAALALVYF